MAEDRYRYFRIEARELLEELAKGALAVERRTLGSAGLGPLLRMAHTLKGAARVVRHATIAELAHTIEELMVPFREDAASIPQNRVDELLSLLDRIGAEVKALEVPAAPPDAKTKGPTPTEVSETFDTIRVDVEEMDKLLEAITESAVRITTLRTTSAALTEARQRAADLVTQLGPSPHGPAHPARDAADALETLLARAERALLGRVEEAERETAEVQERASRLRLVPASAVFPALDRAVRDAGHAVHRDVRLETSGGENRLDAHVLGAVRNALSHVVRNAVVHGIEPVNDRLQAKKPAQGCVRLQVFRRGYRMVFLCSDDGRGIEAETIRKTAIARGLISAREAEALSSEEAIRLIFRGGLTTATETTEMSGRGIGMDVLRATVHQLKGDVVVRTSQGQGTEIEVSVPISISSMPALLFETGGMTASIPLDSVQQVLQVTAPEITRSDDGDSVVYDGHLLRFLSLSRGSVERKTQAAVIVRANGELAAVGVDRLLGIARVLVKRLPRLVQPLSLTVGAVLDAEGNPQLVLDPAALIATARAHRGQASTPAPIQRMPVLVIDDSLTTRMMEQSILESAGYEVELATSAEEALAKAQERAYALFVVDVEMPGMTGFEFLERTRKDPALRETPGILVTSRGSPDDLRRGQEAGARGHIVKSEFDQKRFLDTVQRLIG